MQISVNQKKLAAGLERGIGRVDDMVFDYFTLPRRYRLRYPNCGLASTAIKEYLEPRGVSAKLQISRPGLDFDPELEHVVPVVDLPDSEDPLIIDATYSQFFEYAGMSPAYEIATETTIYPPEKIKTIRFSEIDLFTAWMTERAIAFAPTNEHPVNEYGLDLGRGKLVGAEEKVVRHAYQAIWNPANFTAWEPSEGTLRAGRSIARYIPKDAITIV